MPSCLGLSMASAYHVADGMGHAGPDGKPVEAQVVPVSSSTHKLQSLLQEEGIVPDLEAAATHELVFLARLPPLG